MKAILILALVAATGIVHAQEPELATFQEVAQLVIDKSITQNTTASITLQSTSARDLRIPVALEEEIRGDGRIDAIVLTNQDTCILGVIDEACIIINVKKNPDDQGILEIQESSKMTGDAFIGRINQAFGTDARFHSVFIHTTDASSPLQNTPDAIFGRGVISAVYTMPLEDTGTMYEKISAILLSKEIRESGGFYDVAKDLSGHPDARIIFSIIPLDLHSLLQLKMSVTYPDRVQPDRIDPFEFFDVKQMSKSAYFTGGFYPLNSLIQVVVLLPDDASVTDVRGEILATRAVDGQEIPTDLSRPGWVFDPQQGQKIQGMYLFGGDQTVDGRDLVFALGDGKVASTDPGLDSNYVVLILAIVASAAAIFYLKGFKKS